MRGIKGIILSHSLVALCLGLLPVALPAQSPGEAWYLQRRANPLCYVSVPLQHNFEFGLSPNNGFRWTLNLMPIIPVSLGKRLELTTRIVLPIIDQVNIYGTTRQTGLGDLLINTFFAPKTGRLVWGLGPSVYFPTGFPAALSARKWGAGPGGIMAFQGRRLLSALLLFHLWSFEGDETRPEFSYTYLQPLWVYGFKKGWGAGVTAEIGMEWLKDRTNGSVIVTGQKSIRTGKQAINFVLGPKFYFGNASLPSIGFRATVNLLFP